MSPTVHGFVFRKLKHLLNYFQGFPGHGKRDDSSEPSEPHIPSDVKKAALPPQQTNNNGVTGRDYKFRQPHADKGSNLASGLASSQGKHTSHVGLGAGFWDGRHQLPLTAFTDRLEDMLRASPMLSTRVGHRDHVQTNQAEVELLLRLERELGR